MSRILLSGSLAARLRFVAESVPGAALGRNYINRHDFARAARVLAKRSTGRALERLRTRGQDRVVAHWSEVAPSTTEWWSIGAVNQRWNRLITGDPAVDFPSYCAGRYLAGRESLHGLSVGCGTGHRERRWARLGVFDRLDAVDLAAQAITEARAAAAEDGLGNVLNFAVADAMSADFAGGDYDVLLGLHSLHHFSDLRRVLSRLRSRLLPDGFAFIDEFIGPTKFQWTPRQYEAANGMLRLLPKRYRRRPDGRIKSAVPRPSLLSMRFDDPSEAVESGQLRDAIHAEFHVVEELPYGGTLLHIVLSGIAHNFRSSDSEAMALLHMCFDIEDALLAGDDLQHDFAAFVCRVDGAQTTG